MSQRLSLNVNGKVHSIDVDPDIPLLYALRNDIGLNNPRFGCGLAQCGACTVHLDDDSCRPSQPVRSPPQRRQAFLDARMDERCDGVVVKFRNDFGPCLKGHKEAVPRH
jgi:hypothetical protein